MIGHAIDFLLGIPWYVYVLSVLLFIGSYIGFEFLLFRTKSLAQRTQARLGLTATCFVAGLSAERMEALTAYGTDFQETVFDGEEGIQFAKSQLDGVIAALNATVMAALPTSSSSITKLVLHAPADADETLEYDDDGYRQQYHGYHNPLSSIFDYPLRRREHFFRQAAMPLANAILAPVMRRNVQFLLGKGEEKRVQHYTEHGFFHIYVWDRMRAGNHDRDTVLGPEKVFGLTLPRRDEMLTASSRGTKIVDAASGAVVGELFRDSLYIHPDLLGKRTDEGLAIFARILQAAIADMRPSDFLQDILRGLALEPEAVRLAKSAQRTGPSAFLDGFSKRKGLIATQATRAIVAHQLKADIYVRDCNGGVQAPLSDGMFHVFVNSAPAGACEQGVFSAVGTDTLFGIKLAGKGQGFYPTGKGLPLFSPEGVIYGELLDDNLYLYTNPLVKGNRAESEIFCRMLKEAMPLVALQWQTSDVSKVDESHRDLLCDQVQSLLIDAGQPENREQLEATAADLDNAQEGFSSALRTLIAEQTDLARLDNYPKEALGREFDQLLAINKVEDVEVTKTRIIVKTDTIYCRDPRTGIKHEIGKFDIFIRTEPDEDQEVIRWMNRTRTVNTGGQSTMHAPHVAAHGRACLGNVQDTIPMLINQREFASVIEVAIAFVESVNVNDSWGKHIDMWPKAFDQGED